MSVYIKNGTPLNGPALCETCSYAHIRKGYRVGEEIVICRWSEPNTCVEFRVRECTGYNDKTRPSMYEMERIACTIVPLRSKATAGFAAVNEKARDEDSVELVLVDEE
jgi:hypothetical protein